MKRLFLVALVGAVAAGTAAWFYLRPAPPPALTVAKPVPAVVPLVDGKTIDFSSGRATVKTDRADQANMDAALKDIDAATKDVTFQADPPKK